MKLRDWKVVLKRQLLLSASALQIALTAVFKLRGRY